MTELEGRILTYLATVRTGEWRTSAEIATAVGTLTKTAAARLVELRKRGHVERGSSNDGKQAAWQQTQK